MNEEIRQQIAWLNAAWQRYARATDDELDPVVVEALNRDYRAAWERLDACGIAEWMLAYDPATLTFSWLSTGERANDAFATPPVSAVTNGTVGIRGRKDDPGSEREQLL